MTIVALLVLFTATSNMIPFLPIHFRLVESPTDIVLQDGADILLVRGATLFADAVEVGSCVGFEVVGSAVGDEDMGLKLVGWTDVGVFVVGLDDVGIDAGFVVGSFLALDGLDVGSLVGFLVGATGFVVGSFLALDGLDVGSLVGFLVGATGFAIGSLLALDGLDFGSLVGFLVGATGFIVGVRLVGLVVVGLVVGVLLVDLFDVGFGVVGFAVGTTAGLANGLVVGRGVCGTKGFRGIVLVNVRLPSNINCTSPVKRRYQSEGKVYPSASRASQPFVG